MATFCDCGFLRSEAWMTPRQRRDRGVKEMALGPALPVRAPPGHDQACAQVPGEEDARPLNLDLDLDVK